MRQRLLLIPLFLLALSASAQDSTVRYDYSPRMILKLAPLSLLLDPDATVQVGLEVRISQRNAVQGEIGFGHKGLAITSDDKKNFTDWSIWRVRSEWRHYTGRYRTSNRKNIRIKSSFPLGNYLAIEGFAKQINATKNVVLYDPDPNFPNNQEIINRFVWGSHVKWGRQIAIPSDAPQHLSRVLLDLYVGVGFRYGSTETNSSTSICGCGPIPSRFQAGNSILPSLTAGVKIGFGL
ncbi:hypothetical protein [Spirosoma fluviale]|uniref:DUF3575 domain-containing protein n=1 Tax=Spirosoma fluviale TaxID=1597977 RepID=A0A286FBV8_9BACT|nr:hypothetical protein [Spirosoma fluviale]SOD80728.1 hypothetical protein SAMN06269250_1547 [Spirosoma fluviale]